QNNDRSQTQGGADDDGSYRSRNQQRRDRFRDKRDRFRNREGGGAGDDSSDSVGGQGNQGGERNEQRFERPMPQLPPDFPTYSLNDLKRMPAHKLLEMAETL